MLLQVSSHAWEGRTLIQRMEFESRGTEHIDVLIKIIANKNTHSFDRMSASVDLIYKYQQFKETLSHIQKEHTSDTLINAANNSGENLGSYIIAFHGFDHPKMYAFAQKHLKSENLNIRKRAEALIKSFSIKKKRHISDVERTLREYISTQSSDSLKKLISYFSDPKNHGNQMQIIFDMPVDSKTLTLILLALQDGNTQELKLLATQKLLTVENIKHLDQEIINKIKASLKKIAKDADIDKQHRLYTIDALEKISPTSRQRN